MKNNIFKLLVLMVLSSSPLFCYASNTIMIRGNIVEDTCSREHSEIECVEVNNLNIKLDSEYLNKDSLWGFQIRPNTKFKKGLNTTQINELETQFGFEFPIEYKLMLTLINGLDKKQISINPENLFK